MSREGREKGEAMSRERVEEKVGRGRRCPGGKRGGERGEGKEGRERGGGEEGGQGWRRFVHHPLCALVRQGWG